MPETVPFRDLRRVHGIHQAQSRARLRDALDSGDFARPNGLIEKFEAEWAAYCGTRYAVATSSGSTALLLAFLALDIGAGDEVVTVPNTFVATVEAALLLGADVRLVDVDPETLAIDEDQAIAALGPRTKAVVPLHPFGRLAQTDRLVAACRERGVAVVEEACHAHGAERAGVRAGALGTCGVFSFGPTKPLAGLGEGGAVVTDDAGLHERLRLLNNHGRSDGQHAVLGLNFRIHPIEAAYLSSRLEVYPELLVRRREVAGRYNDAFSVYGVTGNTRVDDPRKHTYYVYVVVAGERDRLAQHLTAAGIGWDVHYPVAVHHQPAHRERFAGAGLSACDRVQQQILSLPLYDGLTDDEVELVVTETSRGLERCLAP